MGQSQTSSGWWFQPIWKICSSNWIISPGRDENKTYLKPPPSHLSTLDPMYWARTFFDTRMTVLNQMCWPALVVGVFPYLPNLHRMPVHWSAPWKHKSRFRSSLSWRIFRPKWGHPLWKPWILRIGDGPLEFLPFFRNHVRKSSFRSFPLPPTVELHLTTIVEQELVGNSLTTWCSNTLSKDQLPTEAPIAIKLAVISYARPTFSTVGALFTDININISR